MASAVAATPHKAQLLNVPPLDVPNRLRPAGLEAGLEEDDEIEVHDDEVSDGVLATFSPHQRVPRGKYVGHTLKQKQRMARWLQISNEETLVADTRQPKQGTPQADEADIILPASSQAPLRRVRCSMVALVVLGLLRSFALNICAAPGWSTLPAHLVSCASDMLAAIAASPLVWPSTWPLNACMKRRCLGPLVTTVLVACICDIGALIIFLRHGLAGEGGVLLRRPFSSGKAPERGETPVQGLILTSPRVGVWACIIISSVLIEAVLCRSTWQLYRALREAAVYPPGVEGLSTHVSPAELVCEAEDVALLAECKAQDCSPECLPTCYSYRPQERVHHVDVVDKDFDSHTALFNSIKDWTSKARETSQICISCGNIVAPAAIVCPTCGARRAAEARQFDDSKRVDLEQAERSLARHSRGAASPRELCATHELQTHLSQLAVLGMTPVHRSLSAPPRLHPPCVA